MGSEVRRKKNFLDCPKKIKIQIWVYVVHKSEMRAKIN